jgi:RimJ/RimL family protein N-acetyltransferase
MATESAEGIPFLVGQRLYLRALVPADADGSYVQWFNDADVCGGNSHHVFPYSREAAAGYIQRSVVSRDELVLAIVQRADHRHIGNIALQAIHPIYRSAELSIVIGDRAAWGQGYGEEASRLLLDHGFRALNLHRVGCGTFATNVAMQRLARGLGMKEEGCRRRAAFKDGRFVDIIEFGIMADEYFAAARAEPGGDNA